MPTKKKKVTHKRKRTQTKKSSPIKKRKMATAKRTHHTKTKTRRKKSGSISGTGKPHADMTVLFAMIAGGIAGKVITAKFGDKLNPKLLAGGQLIGGFLIPKFVKNKMAQGFAGGLMVNGGISLMQSFGVVKGIAGMVGADDDMQLEYLSGTDRLESIAGEDDENMGVIDEGTMSGGTADLNVLAGLGYLEDEGFGDFDEGFGEMEDY